MLPSKLRRPIKASRRSKTAGQTPGQNNARGTDELVARRGNISTDRSLLSIADAAWALANCAIRRFRVAASGVRRARLQQTRTWPLAPIPSATGRPQKICLSWRSRSPSLRAGDAGWVAMLE